MTKLSKKVMSVALAVAVAASSAFSGQVTAQAAETTTSDSSKYAAATLTVKFKNQQIVRIHQRFTLTTVR